MPLLVRRFGVVMALVLVSLSASACGGGAGDSSVAIAQTGDGPLDFTATTVSGAQLDGATLGGSDLVVWFWAPW